MARVPYQPYPEVAPANVPEPSFHIDAKPAAFGTTIAAAVEHLGGTMGQVGNELFSRALAIQDMNNETEANNLKAEFDMKSSDRRDGFFLQQGLNASNGLKSFKEDQNQLREDIRAKASNPAVARMYDAAALGVMNRALVAGSTHAASEARKANTNSYMTGIESDVDKSQYATDDDWRDNILPNIERQTRQVSSDAGKVETAADDDVFKNQSKSWSARIKEMARRDPVGARKLLEEALDPKHPKLHSSDVQGTIARVQTELRDTGARTFANKALDEPKNLEGWLSAKFPGARFPGMNPNFMSRAFAAISAYEVENNTTVRNANTSTDAGVRTYEEQKVLWDKYQAGTGPIAAHPDLGRHVEGRADAIDIGRAADGGKLLDWLHKNAGRFGLEFPVKGDPVHMQLQRNLRGEEPPPYVLPEKHFVDRATGFARTAVGDDPGVMDATRQRTMNDYKAQQTEQLNQNRIDHVTVLQELVQNPAKTVEELKGRNVDIRNAYERLADADPKFIQTLNNSINRVNRVESPAQRAEGLRLFGMSHSADPAKVQQFLDEKINDNPNLSEARRTELIKRQVLLNEHADKADTRINHAKTVTRDMWSTFGTDEKKMDIYTGALLEEIQRYYHENKAYPKDDEIRKMGQQLVLPTAAGAPKSLTEIAQENQYSPYAPWAAPANLWQWYWQGGQGPKLIEKEVPADEKAKIIEEFASKRDLVPTETMIKQAYIRAQLRALREKGKGPTP